MIARVATFLCFLCIFAASVSNSLALVFPGLRAPTYVLHNNPPAPTPTNR